MLSRIDDPLKLTGNGSVSVCGPITWEANEQTADFGFFLRQEDRLLVGRSDAAQGTLMWMGTNLRRTGGASRPARRREPWSSSSAATWLRVRSSRRPGRRRSSSFRRPTRR